MWRLGGLSSPAEKRWCCRRNGRGFNWLIKLGNYIYTGLKLYFMLWLAIVSNLALPFVSSSIYWFQRGKRGMEL